MAKREEEGIVIHLRLSCGELRALSRKMATLELETGIHLSRSHYIRHALGLLGGSQAKSTVESGSPTNKKENIK